MITKTKFKRYFGLLFIIGLFLACSKDGDQGPIGPQGEQGLTGQQGEQGEPGGANIVYSDWIPEEFPEAPIAETKASFNISVADLTDEIKNEGVVLVYGRRPSAPNIQSVRLLPTTSYGPRQQHNYFEYRTGDTESINITIYIDSVDDSPIGFPVFDEYRYVLIPGGIPTSGKSTVDYTKMTYEEITTHFNIPK